MSGDTADVEEADVNATAAVRHPNDCEHSDITPLHLAPQFNKNPAVLEVPLNAGADIQAKNVDVDTPLHGAEAWGTSEASDLLRGALEAEPSGQ